MSLLVARKDIKYKGKRIKRGDPLVPQPEGRSRQILIDGRFVYEKPEATRAELVKEAEALGLTVGSKDNKQTIADAIAEFKE